MRRRLLPAAAAAATGLFVGSTIVATRFVIAETHPASLALLRYLIGFLCLLPVALLAARPRFARADLLPIALLGITQFGVVVALLNYALRFIPSARAALLFATFPLMTLVLAAALGREPMTMVKLGGVSLTVVGVGLALGDRAMQPGRLDIPPVPWLGELAVLASALSGAICSVLYRPYLQRYPTLAVSALAMAASVVFLAALAAAEGFFAAVPRFSAAGWAAVAFIGVSSAVGYFLWLWALRHATPTHVTVFLALSPLTAAGLGGWLLGEPVSPTFLLGNLCVGAGIWLAHRAARRRGH